MKTRAKTVKLRQAVTLLLLAWLVLAVPTPGLAQSSDAPENPAVDTDGAIDLKGSVVVPSRWAVLVLVLFAFLASALVALLAQRQEERREAAELRRRLAEQAEEIERLRSAHRSAQGSAQDSAQDRESR